MQELLIPIALGFFGLNLLMGLALVLYRLRVAHAARHRAETEKRLRPLAMLLIEGDLDRSPHLSLFEAGVLSDLLTRYARRLTGTARQRLTSVFEASGHVDTQLSLLMNRRAPRRASAASALGHMGSSHAVAPLIDCLDDPDRDVRAAAARSLGHLGPALAVPPLVECMVQRTVPRIVAGNALLAIGSDAAPQLRVLLEHQRPEIREQACDLLGFVGRPSDTVLLIGRLRDTEAEVRAKAARALGRLGDERASETLRNSLQDSVPFVRVAAAASLGVIGDRTAIPDLLLLATTDAFDPARAAAKALAKIDHQAVLDVAHQSEQEAGHHLLEAADIIRLGTPA